MKREIRGRRFLITGASGGIGRSLAEQAAQEGARLALVARPPERLAERANTLRSRVAAARVAGERASQSADGGGRRPGNGAAAVLARGRGGGFQKVLGRDAKWCLRCNRFFPRLLDRLIGRRIKKLYAST